MPKSWDVSRQSDGPKNDSAEELFSSASDDNASVKVALGSASSGPDQSLNVQVDQQAIPSAHVIKFRLRTRTGSVTADRLTGYDKINKATLTHVEFTVGTIVVSVLGADEALTVQIARAQAATLPPAH